MQRCVISFNHINGHYFFILFISQYPDTEYICATFGFKHNAINIIHDPISQLNIDSHKNWQQHFKMWGFYISTLGRRVLMKSDGSRN